MLKLIWGPALCAVCCLREDEGCEWYKHNRKTSAPIGNKCSRCVVATKRAWPLKSWDQLVLEKQASTDMETAINSVLATYDGKGAKNFVSEEFQYRTWTGLAIERSFVFLKTNEFKEKFGVEGTDIGLTAENLVDENGQKMSGFMLLEHPYLRVKTYHNIFGDLAEIFQPAGEQLRSKQATEFAGTYMPDLQKTQPRGVTKASEAVLLSKLPTMIAEHLEAAKNKAEEERHAASLVPAEAVAAAEAAEEQGAEEADEDCDDEEDENDESDDDQAPLLVSEQLKQNKRKSKGKGKAKGRGKASGRGRAAGGAGRGKRSQLDSSTSHVSGEDVQSVSTASKKTRVGVHGGVSSASHKSTNLEKARNWRTAITVADVLESRKEGKNLHWQAQQTLTSLQKENNPNKNHEDTILLAAHVALLDAAKDCLSACCHPFHENSFCF
eukprot:6492411-Amphidinium_carterae.1